MTWLAEAPAHAADSRPSEGTQARPRPESGAKDSPLWQAVLGELERDPAISRANFATWLQGTRLLADEDGEYTVGAPHTFAVEKLERSFRGAIEEALRRQTGDPAARIRFAVSRAAAAPRRTAPAPRPLPLKRDDQRASDRPGEPPTAALLSWAPVARPCSRETRSPQPAPVRPADLARAPQRDLGLDPEWTFETFAVGRHNQFAYAAACAVADNPSFAYNPLVVYGPTGAGKSHLLQAIGLRARALRPGAQVAYVSAQTLATEWLRCGADKEAFAACRERYAGADVLLLDDLQLLPALGTVGVGLQLEVAQLVANLLAADAQVVVASHVPPRSLGGLEDPLRVRLQSGLVAELEGRDAIVPAKGVERAGQPAPAVPVPAPRRVVPDDIIAAVAAYFGVEAEALLGKRRDKEVVGPRQVAMYLLRADTDVSLSEIGERLGGRDHSTVLHGYEKVAAQLPHDRQLQADVAAVRQRLRLMQGGDVPGSAAAAAAAP